MDTHCLRQRAQYVGDSAEVADGVLDSSSGEAAGLYDPLKPWVSKGLGDLRKSLSLSELISGLQTEPWVPQSGLSRQLKWKEACGQ